MMGKNKELVETKGNELSTDVLGGIADDITNDDVSTERIGVMTSSSNLVKSEQARQGAIVKMSDGEELGYKDEKAMEFMIVGIVKYWIVKDADSDDFIEKFPAINSKELKWEEQVDGRNLKRTYHFSYIVLLPEEIAGGYAKPYEFAFRSTSVKETEKLNLIIKKLANQKVSSHTKVFSCNAVKRANAKYEWWGAELGIARDASEEETEVCVAHYREFNAFKEQFMAQQEESHAEESGKEEISKEY